MCSFFLTAADVNFALELSDLRHRHGFRIILVHKNQASEALLHHAHELICFEEFISDLPPRLPLKMPVRFQILNSVSVSKCQSPLFLILGESSAIFMVGHKVRYRFGHGLYSSYCCVNVCFLH